LAAQYRLNLTACAGDAGLPSASFRVWFVFMVLLGGAIRSGYSHITDTMSELVVPGLPKSYFHDHHWWDLWSFL